MGRAFIKATAYHATTLYNKKPDIATELFDPELQVTPNHDDYGELNYITYKECIVPFLLLALHEFASLILNIQRRKHTQQ